MMKRRHYLICSIIAMLSIVSYACETEYAICEGGGGTGGTSGDGNGPSENVCDDDDSQKCAESLNGKQVCKDDKWGNDAACNYCFNKNTDNSDATSLVCDGCTPNSYDKSGKKVCYKGAFKKFESKSDSNPNSGIVINSNLKSDDAPWEFAYNNSGSLKYYNCHNGSVFERIKEDLGGGRIDSCCKENDYYIKHIGYKYYSVEVCRKVVFKEGTKPGFWAYEYTDELNNMLIGKKKNLPYSLCHDRNLLIANDKNISENQHSVYKSFACPSNYGCNEKYDELCVIEKFEYNDEMEFECKMKGKFIHGGESIIYDETSVAQCPDNTTLEIQNKDGSWSACKDLKFKLNQARCVPMGIQVGLSSGAAK